MLLIENNRYRQSAKFSHPGSPGLAAPRSHSSRHSCTLDSAFMYARLEVYKHCESIQLGPHNILISIILPFNRTLAFFKTIMHFTNSVLIGASLLGMTTAFNLAVRDTTCTCVCPNGGSSTPTASSKSSSNTGSSSSSKCSSYSTKP
jgi:hypothetical protein